MPFKPFIHCMDFVVAAAAAAKKKYLKLSLFIVTPLGIDIISPEAIITKYVIVVIILTSETVTF